MALVIAVQASIGRLGIQLITGSLVNLVLILSVMLCGYMSGVTVSALSPIFAKLLGIGPLWEIIPFQAAANVIIVTIWYFLGNIRIQHKKAADCEIEKNCQCKEQDGETTQSAPHRAAHSPVPLFYILAAIAGAAAKFLFLFLTVTKLLIPLLNLPAPKAKAISAVFSVQQLFTALIGGGLAVILLPLLKRAIKGRQT